MSVAVLLLREPEPPTITRHFKNRITREPVIGQAFQMEHIPRHDLPKLVAPVGVRPIEKHAAFVGVRVGVGRVQDVKRVRSPLVVAFYFRLPVAPRERVGLYCLFPRLRRDVRITRRANV